MTMYAQITTMRCHPDGLDRFAALYEEQVIPLTQIQVGYRGMYLLLDRAAGTVVSLSLWDNDQDAARYERSTGHQEHLAHCAPYLVASPDGHGYEVQVDA